MPELSKLRAPQVWCQVNRLAQAPHLAERNSAGHLYLYLDDHDAVKWSCLRHAGICHPGECWTAENLYSLRLRTVES